MDEPTEDANEENDDLDDEDMMEENESFAPEDEESEEDDEEEDDMDEEDEMTINTDPEQDNYDEKHVNFEEEKDAYSKIKAARMDEMFPDEVDTPIDRLAKDRFQKFRGLKSFRTGPWDPKEELPSDYGKIFQFENFNRTKKNVIIGNDNEDDSYKAKVGSYVKIVLTNEDPKVFAFFTEWQQNPSPLVAFGMLKHEKKMSVMNVVVKRARDPMNEDPIASKERLIFHVGYRRFAANPIFSAHTNGNKHKYERFWRSQETVVMTMFAPITYPPGLYYSDL